MARDERPTTDPVTEANKRFVVSFVENWFDPDAFAAATADDLERIVEADPVLHPRAGSHGRAESIERLRKTTAAYPDGLTMTVTGVVAEGNRVSVESVASGVRRGGRQGEENRNFRCPFHNVFEVEHGKIKRIREYYDTAYGLSFESKVEQNKRTVSFLMDHWVDTDALDVTTSDDLEWIIRGDPIVSPFAGQKTKADMMASRRRLAARHPEGETITVRSMTAQEDRVVVEVVADRGLSGRDGRPAHDKGVLVFELEEGLIHRITAYVDTAYLQSQFEYLTGATTGPS